MSTWLYRLEFNPKKTKVMLLSSPQMSKTHGLAGKYISLCANRKVLTLMVTFCLFGLEVHENLISKKIRKIKTKTKSLKLLHTFVTRPHDVIKHKADRVNEFVKNRS